MTQSGHLYVPAARSAAGSTSCLSAEALCRTPSHSLGIKKGPRRWDIQRGPKSEELGARSEQQRQAQPTAETSRQPPLGRHADTSGALQLCPAGNCE